MCHIKLTIQVLLLLVSCCAASPEKHRSGAAGKAGSQGHCTVDQQAELERVRRELEQTRTQLNDAQKLNAKIFKQKNDLEKQIAKSRLDVPDGDDGTDLHRPSAFSFRHSKHGEFTSDRDTSSDSSYTMSDIVEQAEQARRGKVEEHRRSLGQLIDDVRSGKGMFPTREAKSGGIFAASSMPDADGLQLPSVEEYLDVLQGINSSDALVEAWHEHMTLERDDPPVPKTAFPVGMFCDVKYRSERRPTSVHKLRPGDIDVIAAMGDSITAGFGAGADWYFLHQYLTEYRGLSWSAGGDKSFADGTTTLPNILREFNPNLKGFSVGTLKFWQNPKKSDDTNLNVAITGSIARDLEEQAERLVRKMKDDSTVDFNKDWKMVTIFIGANNLCDLCNNPNEHSILSVKTHIGTALDILYDQVPRVFVNLVEIFDIAPVTKLATFEFGKLICTTLVKLVNACPCSRVRNPDTKLMTKMSREYQKLIAEIADSDKYNGREDFAVVNQPFFREISPPKGKDGEPDMSYFAQDCFHFSVKGQKRAGKALWNSIIEPVGKKQKTWNLAEPVQCPTMEYLPTEGNSNLN